MYDKRREDPEYARLAWDILDAIPGLVAIDNDGNIIHINQESARGLGFEAEECIGRPVEEISPRSHLRALLHFGPEGKPLEPEITFASTGNTIRRRNTIYRDGVKVPENASGVVAFDILRSREPAENRDEFFRALEQLFLQPKPLPAPGEILGPSSAMHLMKSLINRVAPSSVSVCILGETGTGKELVANKIHEQSKRADKPFVKINCAAIPKDLIESELFGYEPGSFTGASKQGKIGKFEAANGGTLLLDEIGEMPLALQAKLLRVLQSQEVERVGGTRSVPIDVRLLCSTNRDLREMVARGDFRADLYYRINTMEITVPPLRNRPEDIPSLVNHFISEANRKNDLSVTDISPEASRILFAHHWPGNVRELENAVERACILCGTGQLAAHHFSSLLPLAPALPEVPASLHAPTVTPPPTPRYVERERQILLDAIDECKGNLSATARQLGITRATLYARMRKYGVK